jgi:two-component system, chemotaxis family, response regulator Rcp1
MGTEVANFEIFLAEDNPADVVLVREALREHELDCTLHVTRDGEQAIAFLEGLDKNPQGHRLDLVLLDMHLPKRDGEEILKKLRSTERYAQTPVIIMTASELPDDRENAQKHAARHYFQKPTSLAEFLELGAIARSILTDGKHSPTQFQSLRDGVEGAE